jgi:hypothetical protein
MLKQQRDEQKTAFEGYKKTYGAFKCEFDDPATVLGQESRNLKKHDYAIDHEDVARLKDPLKFPYRQEHRLYRRTTNAALKCLDVVSDVMWKVPDTYKIEMIDSREFFEFNRQVLIALKIKQDKEKTDALVFNHYLQMALYGIGGIKASAPPAFGQLLLDQLQPFLNTIQAISSYANVQSQRKTFPSFQIPDDLLSMKDL